MLGGGLDSPHGVQVLLRDVLVEDGSHLHPHLASGDVVVSLLGVLAGGLLEAADLVVVTRGVEKEAHASGQLGLGDGGVLISGPAGAGADGEEAEAKDESLQDQQDQQVGQVESEDLGGGGGPSQKLGGHREKLGAHFVCFYLLCIITVLDRKSVV